MSRSARRTAGALVVAGALTCATALTGAAPAPAHERDAHHGRHQIARCPLPRFGPGASYRPRVDYARLSPDVTNRWFPLVPGRTLVYRGTKDGEPSRDVVTTTTRTRRVHGALTRVVEDRLYLSGVLHERTRDYYAQDRCGTVWYLGEDTAELDARGRVVSREGTWHAGVDAAQPGVFMQAHPQVGRRFRQEWLAGEAEDVFWVVRRSTRVSVPFGTFGHALATHETTRLEPGVLDGKWYVRGIGEVAEVSLRGPREALRLVDVHG